MRPSLFQTRLPHGTTRCDVCQWRCELAPGETGRCQVRQNVDGVVEYAADGWVSAATIVGIEDARMWHFFPDSQVFAVGSYGTPFPTRQSEAYTRPPTDTAPRIISPERIVETALKRLCRGVLWTYNDPIISLEWLLDGLKFARANSRYAVIASSGLWTPEAVQVCGPYLDGLRLDMLGFSDNAYTQLGGIEEWRGILAGVERLRETWNTHIEVTLTLRRAVNDDVEQITALAGWIARTLGSLTPLHLLLPANSNANVGEAMAIAREAGLHFVYGPDPQQPTRCPKCTWVTIQRNEGVTDLVEVINDSCRHCGTALGLRNSIFQRQTPYELPE